MNIRIYSLPIKHKVQFNENTFIDGKARFSIVGCIYHNKKGLTFHKNIVHCLCAKELLHPRLSSLSLLKYHKIKVRAIEMSTQTAKYEQAILYICHKLGGTVRGKKKLAKLLYYADFDFFEQNHISITGDTYKALPMGPFPTSMEEITSKMQGKQMLKILQVQEWQVYNATEVYHCMVEPKYSIFTEEEKRMMDRVVVKYGHLTGKQLEDLTHVEAPYIGTELRDEIPFELAYYRGTDFNEV